jgi:hypothetical protein
MPSYEDMSPWAVHFTAPSKKRPPDGPLPGGGLAQIVERLGRIRLSDPTGYSNALSILGDGRISPFDEPHGAGKDIPGLEDQHCSAAFSEIPLHLLNRLVQNRSSYGIGFSQQFLLNRGGGRVWYLEASGVAAHKVQDLAAERSVDGADPKDPLWKLTPFIDFPDPDQLFSDWRWEREWRVPGGLTFEADDVAFLFIPEKYHEKARRFFTDHEFAGTGPGYLCPYIDPSWDRDRIHEVLAQVPPAVEPREAAVRERMGDW